MIPLGKYRKVKDRYCVAYFGACEEYITLLKFARRFVEEQLPGLDLYIACRDDALYLGQGDPKVIGCEELKRRRSDFAHIRELRCNMVDHPVYEFLCESGITVKGPPQVPSTRKCVISPRSSIPTEPMTPEQVKYWTSMAAGRGFHVQVGGDSSDAGWVVGVESVPLFQAAISGNKTTLIATGLGTEMYQKWFPTGETVKMQ